MRRAIFFSKHMELGGLEKALLNLLNSLDLTKLDVTLVLEEKRGALLSQLDPRIRVEEYRLSGCPVPILRRIFNLSHRMLWAIRHFHRYDFSCSYSTYSVIGSRLAQYASARNCLYVHSDYSVSLPSEAAFRQFFTELRAESFSRLLFVSNESRASFLRIFPQLEARCAVLNNLVDDAQIRARAKEAGPERAPDETVFLFLGRLEEESKRLTRLLQAFQEAHAANDRLCLWMVGDGKDRALCEEQIRRLGLSDAVVMFGAQENPYPFLRQADCLLLTSEYEGFPVVYTEALALEKNIITTIPVSDDALDIASYATLVEKDPHAIAQAMTAFRKHAFAPPDFSTINQERIRRITALIAASDESCG